MAKIPVFICGGHFSPALSLIEVLAKDKKLNLYYIGRKYSLEGDQALSLEYRMVKDQKVTFLTLTTGRLQRHFSIHTLWSLIKIPWGFFQSLFIIWQNKPKLVVSFGGYVALPVCLAAFLFGIPVITHEQTRVLGLSNRIISRFAQVTCLTFSDTQKMPDNIKREVTGLPILSSILNPSSGNLTNFGNRRYPLIYITGGSQGSASINEMIAKCLPQLLGKFRLLHVCGESNSRRDYHRLSKIRMSLDAKKRRNYYLTPFLDYHKVGEVLQDANLVIGRAGANSIAEISILNKRAILIPLPWAGSNEQLLNARYLEKSGLATVIIQKRLNRVNLLTSIGEILNKPLPERVSNLFFRDAASRLSTVVYQQLGKKGRTN